MIIFNPINRRQFIQSASWLATMLGGQFKLTAAQTKGIKLERDGMLEVNGRREFILGLYQPPQIESALEEVRSAGFNLLNRSATRAAYDEIQSHGLWGWSALGALPAAGRDVAEKKLRETIESLKEHPALLCWETEDEPTFAWKEPSKVRTPATQINDTARVIRKLDPHHPLYLNHSPTNLVSTLQDYNAAADLVAMDIYPVIPPGIRELYALWPDGRQGDLLNTSISQVGQYADKMRQVAGPGRAVFMVLQAFAWERLREKEQDPSMLVYPTEAQLRFMAWQSVVHGVNGLIWWGLSYTPPEAPLWPALKRVVGELAQVREALAAKTVKLALKLRYQDTGHSLDRGIEWRAKSFQGDILLMAVNADPNPVDVTFKGLERFRQCRAVFPGGATEWAQGVLRERFEPFGTRVWRLK